MTKRIMLISSVLLTIVIGIIVFYNVCNDNEIIESTNRDNLKVNSNALTMMYEIEADSGEYQVSSDIMWPQEGYTFNAELSKCKNGSKLSWDDENKRVVMQANTSDKCYVYFDKNPLTLADYIINNVYVEDGVNGLYYHDGVGTYVNADQEAGDYSYRYSGGNDIVNNYVCFGSNEEVCSEDNLYRIIGVFDNQVKLIKSTSYGKYKWDNTSNTWDASTKPDICTTLNNAYWNTLENDLQVIIDKTHIWQVGGIYDNGGNDIGVVKNAYNNEVGVYQEGYKETMAIGLMYVSDYGYAAYPNAWLTGLFSYIDANIIANNWLYSGFDEWTISLGFSETLKAGFTSTPAAFAIINNVGFLSNGDFTYVYRDCNIRPTFYLNSDVVYISGDGSINNPYRLS